MLGGLQPVASKRIVDYVLGVFLHSVIQITNARDQATPSGLDIHDLLGWFTKSQTLVMQ